jgi:hypothetical protein
MKKLKSGLPKRIRRGADPQREAISCAVTRYCQRANKTTPSIPIKVLLDLVTHLSDDQLIELILKVFNWRKNVAGGVQDAITYERQLIEKLLNNRSKKPLTLGTGPGR